MPPLSLGPPVVLPFRTTVMRPAGNLTRVVLAHAGVAARRQRVISATHSLFISPPSKRSDFIPGGGVALVHESVFEGRLRRADFFAFGFAVTRPLPSVTFRVGPLASGR